MQESQADLALPQRLEERMPQLRRHSHAGIAHLHVQTEGPRQRRPGVCFQFHLAVGGGFDRVPHQVRNDFAQPHRIPQRHLRKRSVQRNRKSQSLVLCLPFVPPGGAVQRLRQVELLFVQGKAARRNRRALQRRVQAPQQLRRTRPRRRRVFPLLLIQRCFEQQVHHPQNPAQRRPHLVVQAGQKLAFDPPQLLQRIRESRLQGRHRHNALPIGGVGEEL